MKHLSFSNPFCILNKANNNTSVRVILRHEKLYREQGSKLKLLFSIQVLLISIVKLTRIDGVLSDWSTEYQLNVPYDFVKTIKTSA